MDEVSFEKKDGRAVLSTDSAGEWMESDSIVIVSDWA